MAAWGKSGGAWADQTDVEPDEAAAPVAAAPTAWVVGKAKEEDFPDLAAAAKVKETRKEKKKKAAKQTLSLNDFLKSVPGGPALGSAGRRAGDIDILSLPTAPRPRAEGEERSDRPIGGGFGTYGGSRDGPKRYGDEEGRPRRDEEDMGPSRAEMSDNWGADRKPAAFGGADDRGRGGFGGGGYRDGGSGGFRDREGGSGFRSRSRDAFPDAGPSRADEVDDWGKTKAFVPSSGGSRSGGGFEDRPRGGAGGGGFRDRSPPAFREPSRADTEDRWSRSAGADFKPTAFEDRPRREYDDRAAPRRGFGFGDRPGSRDGSRDARAHSRGRELSQDRQWRRADAAPAGGASRSPARGRPRLNLAPRSAAVPAPSDAAAAPKSSVFGAARPREEVLREQGRDAVKEDQALEHEAVDRPETAEEKALRQAIADLQIRVEAGEADAEFEGKEAEVAAVPTPSKEEAGDGKQGSAAGDEPASKEEQEGKEEAGKQETSKEEEEEEEGSPPKTVAQALSELESRLAALQAQLDDGARYKRAATQREHSRDRAPRGRAASPGGESGWRRGGDSANGGGSAPRAFRDDRPARPAGSGGGEGQEDRPSRGRAHEERGADRGAERGRRDNFPPRDRESSRDKPRW